MAERFRVARQAAHLELDPAVTEALRSGLPRLADRAVAAITVEVPSYSGTFTGSMGRNIENAVQVALGTFLTLVERSHDSDPASPLQPALDAAYALGSGEARSGRTLDALLAAYRVGARVSWREMAETIVAAGTPANTVADFAELIFAYIDELSAASAAGHADELASAGRARQRHLERLAQHLLAGADEDVLRQAAERADWPVPETLTAVLVARAHARTVLALLDAATLDSGEELPGSPPFAVLLVPDAHGRSRTQLVRVLGGRQAVLGPVRPWQRAADSCARAARAVALGLVERHGFVDTEDHLAELVLSTDADALADLRAKALQPLSALRPAAAQRLAETLRSWLLHQGRRDDVAADLFVHPQTVRYRMGQLRELYGERLDDPDVVLDLTLALAFPPPVTPEPAPATSSPPPRT